MENPFAFSSTLQMPREEESVQAGSSAPNLKEYVRSFMMALPKGQYDKGIIRDVIKGAYDTWAVHYSDFQKGARPPPIDTVAQAAAQRALEGKYLEETESIKARRPEEVEALKALGGMRHGYEQKARSLMSIAEAEAPIKRSLLRTQTGQAQAGMERSQAERARSEWELGIGRAGELTPYQAATVGARALTAPLFTEETDPIAMQRRVAVGERIRESLVKPRQAAPAMFTGERLDPEIEAEVQDSVRNGDLQAILDNPEIPENIKAYARSLKR